MMPYPNATKTLVTLLESLVGGPEHADIVTPPDLQQRLPFIRVGRVTGPDDGVSDFPVVDVDYFDVDWDAACDGAEVVRDALTLPDYHAVATPDGTVVLDGITTAVGPRQLPWLATGVVRITGTYRVQTRRQ